MADKIEDLDLTPPKTAQENAQKVLDWRDEHGDEVKGMTRTGWVRANQLAEGEELSPEIVKKMSQFNRHRGNSDLSEEYEGEPWKDAGYVAWLGWGGDVGVDWAMRMSERISSIENSGRDKVVSLSHRHKNVDNEDEDMSDEETLENSLLDRVNDNSSENVSEEDVEGKEISKNTYNGYFEGKDFEDDNWADAVDRLRELHGTSRSFITRVVSHEETGHDRPDNVPVFEEPIDSDTIEQFVSNVEENVDEETFENIVEDIEILDNTIRRLFFRMILHDDFMHDREDFEVEQLLSSQENADYKTVEDCVDDYASNPDVSREEAEDICMDVMDLEEDGDESSEELDQVSEGDKVRWDASGGNAYGVVDTVTEDGTVSAEPEGPEMEGSSDEPAVKIQVYELEDDEWTGTETYVVHRFDALTKIEDFPEERSNSETLSEGIMPTHEGLGDYGTQESDDWGRPNYEDFAESYDLDDRFEDLSDEDKRLVAAHFGRVDASNYGEANYNDLQLPHHDPETGNVDRAGVIAARQRLPQSDMPDSDIEAIDTHLTNHLTDDFDEDASKITEENSDSTSEESDEREFENGDLVEFETDYGNNYGRVREKKEGDYVVEIYSAELGGGWTSTGNQKIYSSEELSMKNKLPDSLNDLFRNNSGSSASAQTVEEKEGDDLDSKELDSDDSETSEQLSPSEIQQVGKKVRSVVEVMSDDSLDDYLERKESDLSASEFRDVLDHF